jgi:hypothetical protein
MEFVITEFHCKKEGLTKALGSQHCEDSVVGNPGGSLGFWTKAFAGVLGVIRKSRSPFSCLIAILSHNISDLQMSVWKLITQLLTLK